MPSIMTGLRFSAGISVIALVFTESIGASQGIGYLVSPGQQPAADPHPRGVHHHLRPHGNHRGHLGPHSGALHHAVAPSSGGPMNLPTTQPAAVVVNVTKRFGDREVLADLDLDGRPGRVRRAARRLGQRQDDAAPHSGRARRGDVAARCSSRRSARSSTKSPASWPPCGSGATSCSVCPACSRRASAPSARCTRSGLRGPCRCLARHPLGR